MKTEAHNRILVMYPEGELGKTQELDVNAVSALVKEHDACKVVFDLSACSIITSPGFGWIFGVARECKRNDIAVATCNANEVVARSLQWVNGNLVMQVCTTRAEAMAVT